MMQSKLGVMIGLCLALTGLMAVGASSAQAEVGSYWLVQGVKVTTLLPELTGALENNHGILLGEIGGVGIHILCTGFTFVAGNHLLAEGGWLGKGQFSGCKVLRLTVLNGATQYLPECLLPGGLVTTNTLKGLIRLSSGSPVVVLEPNSGTVIVLIDLGDECLFGECITINGKFGAQDAAFLTDQVTHLYTEHSATTELYINGNKANKATLDGSAEIKLARGHAGLKWSGHPA